MTDARSPDPARPTPEQLGEFGATFRAFLEWVSDEEPSERHNEVVELVTGHLGDGVALSVVTRSLPPFEHVNLQTALNAWSAEDDRTVAVHGFVLPPHFGPITLQQLLGAEDIAPLRLSAPALTDLANGPGSTLACLQRALLLVEDAAGRYVILVNGPSEHEPALGLEVAGLDVVAAQALLAHLDALRGRLNVYRGHVLDVALAPMGGVTLTFATVAPTSRDEVVLPPLVLHRIERHAIGVATHRDQLRAAGQHLKRGLLLYGPPGTGKTHTMRYLVGQLAGYTRLLLAGRALHAIESVAELARELAPAVVVLEDVDLVAEDRGFGHGSSPVLFDLLDAMDGAAADADLLFVLTTNRADLLEPALAARPGRVDVAVEIDLPDETARRRLLDLYGAAVPLHLDEADAAEIVARSSGVTASFLKELVRRAVLESLEEHSPLREVDGSHVLRALAGLLDSTQEVTRSLLGVGNDPEELPGGGGLGSLPPGAVPGRMGWAPMRHRRAYRDQW